MTGAIGDGEWYESCARGLRPAVASRPSSENRERKVSATDHMADSSTHFRLPVYRMLRDASGPLKSALDVRLPPTQEGGHPPRRLLGV